MDRYAPPLAESTELREPLRSGRLRRLQARGRTTRATARCARRATRESRRGTDLSRASRMAPLLPRHRHGDSTDDPRRVARHRAFCFTAPVECVPGSRPVRALERRERAKREHHQSWKWPRQTRARRGRLALQAQTRRRQGTLETARGAAQWRHRDSRRRAAAALSSLPTPRRARKTRTKIAVAIARELAGFVWAALNQTRPPKKAGAVRHEKEKSPS